MHAFSSSIFRSCTFEIHTYAKSVLVICNTLMILVCLICRFSYTLYGSGVQLSRWQLQARFTNVQGANIAIINILYLAGQYVASTALIGTHGEGELY